MTRIPMNYSVSAHNVMKNPEFARRLKWMADAGVKCLWLSGFMYGHPDSDPELMYQARRRLTDAGFDTGVISLPVGHPGNSLNPDDPTLDLAIAKTWRYRVDRHGEKEYFISCIDDVMTADNIAAARQYAEIGFTRHFFDDDLRLGNWGEQVQGCFCDACIEKFNRLHGTSFSRAQLAVAADRTPGMEDVCDAWIQYNCDKLTAFMRDTNIPGMTSGIMVMHNGGRAHGISIPDIIREVPDCMFRVGEYHFDDQMYTAPGGKECLAAGVRGHMRLIGDNPAYSESTVFPAAALSPENLIDKIRLELHLGLRNIFLMSGSWFLSEPYWKAIAEAHSALEDLAAELDG